MKSIQIEWYSDVIRFVICNSLSLPFSGAYFELFCDIKTLRIKTKYMIVLCWSRWMLAWKECACFPRNKLCTYMCGCAFTTYD